MPSKTFFIQNTIVTTWLLVILSGFSNSALAQELSDDLRFTTVKEGISKRAITQIVEDNYGFLWFSTIGTGLYRFDGVSYQQYTYDWDNATTIGDNAVYSIYEDSQNRLWVGTGVGLSLYNRELDQFERIALNAQLKLEHQPIPINSLNEFKDGGLLLGTEGLGFLKVTLNPLNITKIQSDEKYEDKLSVKEIIRTETNLIYVASNKGLKAYNEADNRFVKAEFKVGEIVETINESLFSLITDEYDNLWLGTTNNGLLKISKSGDENYSVKNLPFTNNRILSLLSLEEGKIMAGAENDGLFLFDNEGKILENYVYDKFNPNSIASNSIWTLFSDNQQRIWLGYYNKGVGVYDRLYSKFKTVSGLSTSINPFQSQSVNGIIEDWKGRIWIAMDGGGIDVFDPQHKIIQHINTLDKSFISGLKSNDIQTIFIDGNNNIWVGSWSAGIYFLKYGATEFEHFTMETTNGELNLRETLSFSEDSKGNIWIAGHNKPLHYYNPYTKRFYACDTDNIRENSSWGAYKKVVYVDHLDKIWLGTASGLYKLEKLGEDNFSILSMRDFMLPAKLQSHPSTHHILSIYEDEKNQLWVGTEGAGLFKYDSIKGVLNKVDEIAEFKETSINSIMEDAEEGLWVGGKAGITRINTAKKTATNFTVEDGLLGNYFNNNSVLKSKAGLLYFGGYSGINYIDPNKISFNQQKPLLFLTDLKLFNKIVSPNHKDSPLNKVLSETTALTLNYNQSIFTIEYTGVGFTRPENNEYAYILEGFEPDWNYVGTSRSATYTNIPAGEYNFKVKAANNDGIWNHEPLVLKLTILPPWWQTNTAYLSYVLLFLAIALCLYRYLKERFKERQSIRIERENRVREEQLNNRKLQFFTNISHEFRTPLTLIKNPIEDLIQNTKLKLSDEVKEKHHIIYKNADRLSRLIDELLDFRKLQTNKFPLQVRKLNVVEEVANMVGYFKQEAVQRGIELNFLAPTNELIGWVDANMLDKIVFNLLSNAFKVTPEEGIITVGIKRTTSKISFPLIGDDGLLNAFEIFVEDTGPGLDQKEYKKIFKRFYQIGSANKSYYGSTGIGLDMVKSFMALHKGKIEVESAVGKGSTFRAIFPLGNEHFAKNELINSIESKNENTLAEDIIQNDVEKDKHQYSLLIVEDNIELRGYLKSELGGIYNILEARNGSIGLELAKEHLPHLILTDVVMPQMNGFELCKKIKGDVRTSHIPLLMLTAKVMVEDKLQGIDSGADAYLTKPFNMVVLKATLAQLLTSRQLLFNKNYEGITDTSKEKTTTWDNVFVKKVLGYINEHIDEPNLSVANIAEEFNLSRSQLYRKIKSLTGDSVNEFVRKVRLNKAEKLLENGDININEVAYQVGFSSPSYFTKCYKAEFGYLPTER